MYAELFRDICSGIVTMLMIAKLIMMSTAIFDLKSMNTGYQLTFSAPAELCTMYLVSPNK